jgi:hypothetical protein
LDYLIKHQLIEKYFSNFLNFNTNSSSFKESFNTYTNLNRNALNGGSGINSGVSPMGVNRIEYNLRKHSMEFVDDAHSNMSNSDLFHNNFMLSYNTIDNRDENLEDLITSNQISTNFFSRNIKSSFEKF